MRKELISIELELLEGPTALCRKLLVFDNFFDANLQLKKWSHYAPQDGSYLKCSFVVTWDDNVYEGRYDIKNPVTESLEEYIITGLAFNIGLYCPPHMLKERYEEYVKTFDKETVEASLAMLSQADFGAMTVVAERYLKCQQRS